MKKYGLIVAGFIFLIMALAGSQAWAADKTGFVSVKEVVFSTAMGKKATEDFNKARTNLRDKDNELKKLSEEMEKQRPLLKEDVYKEKEVAFNKKKRDFQILVKDTEEEFQVKEQELYQKIVPEIMGLIRTIGEKEKYTMIIDVSAIPLAYWSKESDITKRVIDDFNKSYKPKK
jgi:outer membrane protein